MIKDIVVRLDANPQDEVRIACAEQIAARHDAFVTGIYLNRLPNIAVAGDSSAVAAQIIVDQQSAALKTGDAGMAALGQRFDRLGVNHDLRRYDVFDWQAGEVLTTEARTADLLVDLRPYGHPFEDHQTTEAVMFGSGRSTLLLPPGAEVKDFDTVMVCWINTREAARAVTEALPILQRAELTHVVMAKESWDVENADVEPGADIARHLDRHGVSVELVHINSDNDTGTALLGKAAELGADLIVMGGYGHSRFREWALGGVTLHILTRTDMPVLVAH
ncbi:MAG TPA: universal stress protein [Devosiaceae bacterium]|nr:universal stress protein [Devosiaceae bacterium]